MRIDVATEAMPDFRNPEFRDAFVGMSEKSLDLATAYLLSITALTLGLECEFRRKPVVQRTRSYCGMTEYTVPTFCKITSGDDYDQFWGSVSTSKLNPEIGKLTKNKAQTRRVLAASGVKTALGGLATAEMTEALNAMKDAGISRFLVKPNEGSLSRGVMADISYDEAVAHITANPEDTFIVEQYLVGTEFRLYAVGGKFVDCFAKIPDHIAGDGKKPVAHLLQEKIQAQLANPETRSFALKNRNRAQFLIDQGVKPDYIPKPGEMIWLTSDMIPNNHSGRLRPTGVSNEIKKLASDVCVSLKSDFLAMDVIDRGADGSYILEANVKPNFSGMCFPINAPWNLRMPEALIRNSIPNHKDVVRQIKRYDYASLIKTYMTNKDVDAFNVKDFVEFA